tara:strand:+ start:411 stop:542 length:132 start_codon:yes stop_codon:yes gene_type:complete
VKSAAILILLFIICYAVYKTLLLKEDNNIEENLKNYKTKNNEK